MRAVRLHAPGEPLRVEDVPLPEPTGTQVRVRVAGCGVCHTDLHVVDGTMTRVELPRTLGHEVAGWIDDIGPEAGAPLAGAGLEPGTAVVVYGGWGCGGCRECRIGAEQRCALSVAPGFQADGGYADHMLVPHPRHLVPLDRIDPVRAGPLADAGITAHRAVSRALPWLVAGARVLVIGCGGVGQFVVQFLRLLPEAGADVFVAVRELSPARLDRATWLGADLALLASEPAATLEAIGGPADVVFDIVGTDATLAHAAAVVGADGLVVLVGEAGGSHPFGFDHLPLEAWLTSVAWGAPDDLREVVRLAQRGRVRWDVDLAPLEDAANAHARLREAEPAGRIVLVPGGG